MRRFTTWILLAGGLPVVTWAQSPAVYPHSIVNAASFVAPGLPAGSIARGSIFTIFGSSIGPAQGTQVSAFPLQNTFNGVSITVTQGATVVNALPLYVGRNQINAVMPSNAPLGWVSLHVAYNNERINPAPVFVVNDSVGIFTSTGTGLGPGAVNNFVSESNQPANSAANAAEPGQIVTMFASGLGPISAPDNQAPPAGTLPTPVEVWVGGIPASVSYSGRSPCCSGLDQIVFTVPSNAPTGCWVPVQVRTSSINVSNTVSMAIGSKGAPCSDPTNPVSAPLISGTPTGILSLTRTAVHEDVGINAPIDVVADTFAYSAAKQPGGPFVFSPLTSAPPPGTCAVYAGVGDYWATGQIPDSTVSTALDVGSQFSITTPSGPQQVTLSDGLYGLGAYLPLYGLPNQLVLSPGSYAVSGSGGADVGAVKVSITVPEPITWTNRDQTTIVNRSQPLTLTWSGGSSGQQIQILGENSDLRTNSSSLFFCIAPAGATSFTVPPQVLASISPTRTSSLDSTGIIFVISSSQSPFAAPGLKAAFASAVYKTGKTVVFQ
jgi:uncharacterized protein (TIGR03437 family)